MSGVRADSPNHHSSSPDLSSPPSGSSPPHHIVPSNHAPNAQEVIHISSASGGVTEDGERAAKKVAARDPSAAPKRARKKREPDSQAASNTPAVQNGVESKPKKPRIPRGTGPQAMRKKAELEAKRAAEAAALQASHQTKFEDGFPRPTPPPAVSVLQMPAYPQNGNHEAIPASQPVFHQTLTPQPRPSSGQNYDPIRSSTVAPRPTSPLNLASTPSKPTSAITTARSPSISSLIDPPDTMRSYINYVQAPKRESENRPPSPQDSKRPRLSPPSFPPSVATKSPLPYISGYSTIEAPRPASQDNDQAQSLATPKQPTAAISKKPTPTTSKGPSPGSHSPKTAPRKEAASLPSAGSGLLSGSVFGGSGGLDGSALEKSAPTVVINVPLTGDNQYINFTRLAEEKYGFNALHPRLAAQRDRLARVAAAGAALENANKNGGSGMSADEMSVDLSNDEGDNSNVEMGGIDGGLHGMKSGEDTGEAPKRRKRVMKEDMYDKDDDFIDDTEQAWEEQAAVSKDGFFVYSGPLVPDGEEAKVER